MFITALIMNDGHAIFARLNVGDDIVDIVDKLDNECEPQRIGRAIRAVGENWPPHPFENIGNISEVGTEQVRHRRMEDRAASLRQPRKLEPRDRWLHIELDHPPFPIRTAQGAA